MEMRVHKSKSHANPGVGRISNFRLSHRAASVNPQSSSDLIRDLSLKLAELEQALALAAEGMGRRTLPEQKTQTITTKVWREKILAIEGRKWLRNMDAQGKAARKQEFESGHLLSAAQFQQGLQISRQAISKAIKDNRMFYIDGPSGENLYPAFFTDAKQNRRNLERVCKVLNDLPGASKWQFFTTAKHSLGGRTPIDALAAGDVEKVLTAAAGFVER